MAMLKRCLGIFLITLALGQIDCQTGLVEGGLIEITLISNNKDDDSVAWTLNILNGGSFLITRLDITVDFYFSSGAEGRGTESQTYTLPSLDIDVGQTHRWEALVEESHLGDGSRDFANLTTVSVRTLVAFEFGVEVALETYSGLDGKIY